jgi:hypothetical protein
MFEAAVHSHAYDCFRHDDPSSVYLPQADCTVVWETRTDLRSRGSASTCRFYAGSM